MQSRALILTSLLLPALVLAQALPPDDFFHSGAQWYLSNKVAEARSQVDAGLKLYPDDIKLKKLDELLKKQQQQNQNQQQNQEQKDQEQKDKQEQEKQQQQQQDQQQGGKDQKDQQQQQQEKERKEQERKERERAEREKQQEQQKKDGQEPKPGEPQPGEEGGEVPAGLLTPQQARQILDALKSEEKMLPVDLQKATEKPGGPRRIKDW